MNCNQTSERLDAFLDGEMESSDMAKVRKHVEACERCAAELSTLKFLKSSVKALPAAQPDDGFEDRLVRVVFSEVKRSERRENRFWAVTAACATCLVMLGMVAAISMREARYNAAERKDGAFELSRDQAYVSGEDPLSGGSVVIPAGYGR